MRLCGSDCQIILVDEMYTEDDRLKHTCCGGSVHIKQAASFVAVSALALSILNGLLLYYRIYSINLIVDLILLSINTTAALVVFYALYYEKAAYLLPFIVTQIVQCALFFFLALCTVYFLIVYKKQTPNQRFDQIVMIVSIAIGIVISGWAIWVVTKCYHYLRSQVDAPVQITSTKNASKQYLF